MERGKYYEFSNGTIVLCTEDNLETFRGVVVKAPHKKVKGINVGHYSKNWNTDGEWKEVDVKLIVT